LGHKTPAEKVKDMKQLELKKLKKYLELKL